MSLDNGATASQRLGKRRMPRVSFMRRAAFPASLILLFLNAVFLPAVTASQGGSGSPRPTRLNLGYAQSLPGSEVTVSLTLTLPQGVKISSAMTDIVFPGRSLSFQEARRAISAEVAGADLQAEVRSDPENSENRILSLKIESKAGNPIPQGVLADLVFRILDTADLGSTVTLVNRPAALTASDPSQPVTPVSGNNGEIVVDEPMTVFSCFFYMH